MFNNFTRIHTVLFSFLIFDHFGQATGPDLLFFGSSACRCWAWHAFFFFCARAVRGCFLIFCSYLVSRFRIRLSRIKKKRNVLDNHFVSRAAEHVYLATNNNSLSLILLAFMFLFPFLPSFNIKKTKTYSSG